MSGTLRPLLDLPILKVRLRVKVVSSEVRRWILVARALSRWLDCGVYVLYDCVEGRRAKDVKG